MGKDVPNPDFGEFPDGDEEIEGAEAAEGAEGAAAEGAEGAAEGATAAAEGATAAPEPKGKEPGVDPRIQRLSDRVARTSEQIDTLSQENARLSQELAHANGQIAGMKPGEKAAEVAPPVDMDALYEQHAQHVALSETKEAAQVMKKIMAETKKQAKEEALHEALTISSKATNEQVGKIRQETVQQQLEEAVGDVFKAHPELDHTKPDTFDEAKGRLVRATFELNLKDGKMSHAKALRSAVDEVYGVIGTPAAPTNKGQERDAAAIKRAAAASQNQPAPLTDVGVGSRSGASTLDPQALSDVQIKALAKSAAGRVKMFGGDVDGALATAAAGKR